MVRTDVSCSILSIFTYRERGSVHSREVGGEVTHNSLLRESIPRNNHHS